MLVSKLIGFASENKTTNMIPACYLYEDTHTRDVCVLQKNFCGCYLGELRSSEELFCLYVTHRALPKG
jgi:hypothetical protein